MNLTVAFITSRREPKIEWFFDSLALQIGDDEIPDIIVVDSFAPSRNIEHGDKFLRPFIRECGNKLAPEFTTVVPKPNIWQGKYRITKEDWWAKSNAMNTAICLCATDWIAFVDDRCVLVPAWLQCVREAMDGNYAVCGRYEKRANMKVENGVIVDEGELLGLDQRPVFTEAVFSRDWYGGSCAVPLEWCLRVNGFPEMADGLGMEDCLFGETLLNNGFPMKYDARMKIIEDRTPSEIDGALKRADKNSHLGQQAKSWTLLRAIRGKRDSQNPFDIRNVRDRVLLNHESLDSIGPFADHFDYYDGQPVSEME